jgi:hypothetical protein
MSDPYAGRAFAPSGAKTPRAGPYREAVAPSAYSEAVAAKPYRVAAGAPSAPYRSEAPAGAAPLPYREAAGAASPPYYVKEDAAEEAAPFPQNEAVQFVWLLFWIFWGSLVCLYVPLCLCSVPYTGPTVEVKKSHQMRNFDVVDEARYRFRYESKKGTKQEAEREAERLRMADLIKHMYCNQFKENPTNDVNGCWDSFDTGKQNDILGNQEWIQQATKYLKDNHLNAAKEAWNRDNKNRLEEEKEKKRKMEESYRQMEESQREMGRGPLLPLP